ncbi:MAG TPA: amino acid permease [Caulobacteraceae bacterium]|jgi:APA family basic amino acid/polyamine antiporter
MSDTELTEEGLRVAIGLPSAVMLVMGGIIGVGIFVNPAVVARSLHSPELVLAAWGAGGLVALLGAFVYAELAAHIPATGGEYVYLRSVYGPLVAFLFGWTTLLVVQAGGLAAVSIVFAKNLAVLSGGVLNEKAVIVATLAALAGVNCLGVKAGDRTQAVLGVLKVVVIAALIGAGFAIVAPAAPAPSAAPAAGGPIKAFGAALIPVVFSYGGWQTANYVAGEVRQAGRNLARALLIGVAAVIALYLLVNLACLHGLGVSGLAATLTPASDVLERAVGPAGARLAAAAVALSALAFISQGMLTGPRVTFAMARDGLFFRAAGQVSARARVPVIAILLQAAWTAVLALSGTYERILSYVIAMNFLFFGLSASCLFFLRRRAGPEGFRAPFHPFTTGAFIAACVVVVGASFWAYPVDSLIGYAILAAGVPPYLYWRGKLRRT